MQLEMWAGAEVGAPAYSLALAYAFPQPASAATSEPQTGLKEGKEATEGGFTFLENTLGSHARSHWTLMKARR